MDIDLDTQTGINALRIFHNASLQFPSYQTRNWEDFFGTYGNKGHIYAEGVGLMIRANNMSPESVKLAMETLAKTAQGRIPVDHHSYIHALSGQASKVSYLNLAKNVVTDVGSAVATGAQTLGSSITTSLSWLTTLLPFLAVGGALLFILNYSGAGSAIVKEVSKARGRKKKVAAK